MSETDFRLLPEGLKRCVRDCKALIAAVKVGTFHVPQRNASRTIGAAAPRGPAAMWHTSRSPGQGLPSSTGHACSQQQWGEFAGKQA